MSSLFGGLMGGGNSLNINIELDGIDTRKQVTIKGYDCEPYKLPMYKEDDDISGTVTISLNKVKKYDHNGISVELVGRVEVYNNENLSSNFMSMQRELEPSGTLNEEQTFKFQFNKFEKEIETFHGKSAKIRYFVRVQVRKQQQIKYQKTKDIAVYLPTPQVADRQEPIKLEVGIDECLHIEFEYTKNMFHLKDVITGKVSFMLVRIRLKYMEIQLIKREIQGSGANQITDNETLVKYKVMDGCPHKGEVIPIRMYLAGIDLTPSSKNVSGKFTVKHFINLVLVDEDDRRYFKSHEITFYRKK